MATGWAAEGAVQEQIDSTVKDAIARARSGLSAGPSLSHCAECGEPIPFGRQRAIAGVSLCVACQQEQDDEAASFGAINRRGSKDSQLR